MRDVQYSVISDARGLDHDLSAPQKHLNKPIVPLVDPVDLVSHSLDKAPRCLLAGTALHH